MGVERRFVEFMEFKGWGEASEEIKRKRFWRRW